MSPAAKKFSLTAWVGTKVVGAFSVGAAVGVVVVAAGFVRFDEQMRQAVQSNTKAVNSIGPRVDALERDNIASTGERRYMMAMLKWLVREQGGDPSDIAP